MERIEHKCVRYALFALQPEEALNFAKQQKISVLWIVGSIEEFEVSYGLTICS